VRSRLKRSLPAFSLLPDEAFREMDIGEMFLARDRVLKGVTPALTPAFGSQRALPSFTLNRDLRLDEAGDLESGAEDLPRQAAEFAGENVAWCLDLLVTG
jgi:uncharacterized protein involved in tellurium resistance